MTLPCQNREPAKDERKTLWIRPRVAGQRHAGANNVETQRRVLADCEQIFEDVGSGVSWNPPGLHRLKEALQPGDCVKVAALDRLAARPRNTVYKLQGYDVVSSLARSR